MSKPFFVFCGPEMTVVVKALKVSEEFKGWYNDRYIIAYYDPRDLPDSEEFYEEHNCWWREITRANINVEYDISRIVDEGGVIQYLEARYGVSALRNQAACIGEMAYDASMDPIELINKIQAALKEASE